MITCIPTGSYATVDIIAAITLGTMEQLAIVLPCQGIIDTSIVSQTVRTLSIVGNELANFITTHTNDNAIVGTQVKSCCPRYLSDGMAADGGRCRRGNYNDKHD